MKIHTRTHHPPGTKPVFVNDPFATPNRVEAASAIKDLCLSLMEARSLDEYPIGYETDELAMLWELVMHTPYDLVAILKAWRSFRLPAMVDGSSAAYERAVEKMEVFLNGQALLR